MKHIGYCPRSPVPAAAGYDISPIQRPCAADDPNGGFAEPSFERWSSVSPDLTVRVVRQPVGCLAVTNDSVAATTGSGLADAALSDIDRRLGRWTASLPEEPR